MNLFTCGHPPSQVLNVSPKSLLGMIHKVGFFPFFLFWLIVSLLSDMYVYFHHFIRQTVVCFPDSSSRTLICLSTTGLSSS